MYNLTEQEIRNYIANIETDTRNGTATLKSVLELKDLRIGPAEFDEAKKLLPAPKRS